MGEKKQIANKEDDGYDLFVEDLDEKPEEPDTVVELPGDHNKKELQEFKEKFIEQLEKGTSKIGFKSTEADNE